jgi:hypothetical protein
VYTAARFLTAAGAAAQIATAITNKTNVFVADPLQILCLHITLAIILGSKHMQKNHKTWLDEPHLVIRPTADSLPT